MTLRIGAHWLPAMLDSGFSLSFIRQDDLDNIKELGLPCIIESAEESCVISEMAKLGIQISYFSWKCHFWSSRIFPFRASWGWISLPVPRCVWTSTLADIVFFFVPSKSSTSRPSILLSACHGTFRVLKGSWPVLAADPYWWGRKGPGMLPISCVVFRPYSLIGSQHTHWDDPLASLALARYIH